MNQQNQKLAFVLVSGLCLGLSSLTSGYCTKDETQENSENKPKVIHVYPGEQEKITKKKEQDILEPKRNYTEKSDFVTTRDEVEGRVKKVGEKIKEAFK